jgi:PAS domain S-box-containing protein
VRAPPGPALEDVVALLDGIQGARDLSEALVVLVERVLLARGVERAVGLVRDGAVLRGVAGVGIVPAEVRRIALPMADDAHPAVRALASGARADGEGSDDPALVGLGPYAALPVGMQPEGEVCAALLLGLPAAGDPLPEGVEALLGRAEPGLARLGELERLRASDRALRRRLSLFTTALDALPDPVLVTDAENNVLLRNRRAGALLTVPESANEGRRRAVEINNLLFSSFLSRVAMVGPAAPAQRDLNMVDPLEGADLLFEVISTPLPAGIAGESATVSILRDVTDLKRVISEMERQFQHIRQAEVQARRERDRLNLILENVTDPIVVTDSRSNIVLMNPQAERLFDVPAGMDARSVRRQKVQANDTQFSSFILGFALSGDPVGTEELRLADPDTGEVLPVEVVSGKVSDERGELTAIVSIVHDLRQDVENRRLAGELSTINEELEDRVRAATAELAERNRQLEWQSRELERAYRLKSEFLASMSHELRTPINALIGYTSLMRDHVLGGLTERQREALERMSVASRHLLDLVNDILDLAKIEAGRMPVHLERVEIRTVLRELADTVEPLVRKKGLAYRVEVDPELPALRTDPTKLKQIVYNLLSNAVKFTSEGEIHVRAAPAVDGGGVEIEVRDTGIGISAENLAAIFEDFRQVDQSATREFGGTGLGLSIVRKLLGLLGGSIRVDSAVGQGSRFTVRLPLESPPIGDEAAARKAAEGVAVVYRSTGDAEGPHPAAAR